MNSENLFVLKISKPNLAVAIYRDKAEADAMLSNFNRKGQVIAELEVWKWTDVYKSYIEDQNKSVEPVSSAIPQGETDHGVG